MKTIRKYMMCIGLLALCLASCDENKESVIPAELTNLSISTDPGTITLHWAVPEDMASIRYIQVKFYDPRLKKDVLKTASAYSDQIVISDTRKKYGDYTFKIQTVSRTGDVSAVQELKITSEPAPTIMVYNHPAIQVPLTASSFSTNAQSSAEGPVGNLANESATTYFHSDYSGSRPPRPHWFQVNLGDEITGGTYYRIWYQNRANTANKPSNFDLLGSLDANDWFLLRNFTLDADGMNIASGGEWTSDNYFLPEPIRYLRFSVNNTTNSTNTGGDTDYFTMATFKFYTGTITIVDPEDPNEDF